jgi:hypothetical protein
MGRLLLVWCGVGSVPWDARITYILIRESLCPETQSWNVELSPIILIIHILEPLRGDYPSDMQAHDVRSRIGVLVKLPHNHPRRNMTM